MRKKKGEYNLIFFNGEHFARWYKTAGGIAATAAAVGIGKAIQKEKNGNKL
ncbi:hypothetical protein AGMMS49944_10420 [Spirochaetia bacterium]|nr:hypothetical protein AGMMS49944_10420 [Spirochaetia bacterium]